MIDQLSINNMANFYRPINNKCLIPIGGVYISINNVDPSTLFGGTWERLKGVYLMSGDPDTTMEHKTIGSVIGVWWPEVSGTALTWYQMPKHSHGWDGGANTFENIYISNDAQFSVNTVSGGYGLKGTYNTVAESGGNEEHKHTCPAYPAPTIVLNVWYRKA